MPTAAEPPLRPARKGRFAHGDAFLLGALRALKKKKKINPPKQTLPLHVWLLPPGETERETEPHVTDVNRII